MKLSARQKEALDLLRQADMTIVMLAERMGLHRYTAGRIVRELKQAGLVCWRGSAKREGRGARPAVFGVYRAEEAKKRSSSSVVCVKARSAELASALDLPAGDSIIGVGWDFERRVARRSSLPLGGMGGIGRSSASTRVLQLCDERVTAT